MKREGEEGVFKWGEGWREGAGEKVGPTNFILR